MENILFNDRVRKKSKSFWNFFFFTPYYKSEKINFKEKVYTFHYNMEKTGLTTQGELDWSERMMKIDFKKWEEMYQKFKADYVEFAMSEDTKPL